MSSQGKILIVEDEEGIRSLVKTILSVDYEQVDTAENGEVGIGMLEKTRYDLVIADLMMPVKDGIEVLKFAKKKYDDIIVLIMTGKATLDSAIQAVSLGAEEYITKPFNTKYLLQSVSRHLEQQRLKRENIELQHQIARDRDQLKKNYVELSILYKLAGNLRYNFDISAVYKSILESLSEAVENDFCAIYECDKHNIQVKSSVALAEGHLDWLRKNIEEYRRANIPGELSSEEISIIILEQVDRKSETDKIEKYINILLSHKDEPIGVLNVSRFSSKEFSESDINFLVGIAKESSAVFSRMMEIVESQKSKVQHLIDEVPDGIIMHDQNDNAIIINPAAIRMLSFGSDNRLSMEKIERLLGVSFDNLYNREMSPDESFIHETTIEVPGCKKCVIAAHVRHLADPDGMPQGILMALRDVTRERELSRLKNEFISNVSHELRTPAAVIKEFITIFRDRIAGPLTDNQEEYIRIMYNNVTRLLNLIENLLNINRLEAGTLKLRKRIFKPNPLLVNVVESMKVRFQQKNIALKVDIQNGIPEMYADPDAITQILYNCLDNARKFSYDEGEVLFTVSLQDSNLCMSIKDFGRGMPADDLPNIFSRFYRVESKDEPRAEGSGLGLAIVKEFVDLHNGTIRVESELKKGTTFYITIPIKQSDG